MSSSPAKIVPGRSRFIAVYPPVILHPATACRPSKSILKATEDFAVKELVIMFFSNFFTTANSHIA